METKLGLQQSRMLEAVYDLATVVQSRGRSARGDMVRLRKELAAAGVRKSAALDALERTFEEFVGLDPGRFLGQGGADPGGSSPGGSSPGGSSPGGSSPGGSSPGGSSPGGSSPGGSSPGGSSPGGSSPGGSSPGGSSPGGSSPGDDDRASLFNAFADLASTVQLVSIVTDRLLAGVEDMRRSSLASTRRLEQEVRTLGAIDRRNVIGDRSRSRLAGTSPGEDLAARSFVPRAR